MGFDWHKYRQSGEYVSFKEVGDRIGGEVLEVREGRDFNGRPCPELVLVTEDGEQRIVTAGQIMLFSALAEQSPEVGDRLEIVFTGTGEQKPGKAPTKLFDVKVERASGPAGVTAADLL